MIETYGLAQGKDLYAECVVVKDPSVGKQKEVFTSIYTNANYQAEQYCKTI